MNTPTPGPSMDEYRASNAPGSRLSERDRIAARWKAIRPADIVEYSSPKHIQSVLEDMQRDIAALASRSTEEALTDQKIATVLRQRLRHFTTWSNVTLEQMMNFAKDIAALNTSTPSYCSDERPCTPCFSNNGECEDTPPRMDCQGGRCGHASDCAVHNEPAEPTGSCDCGAAP